MFKKLPQLMFSLMISKGESVKTSFIRTFVIWVFKITMKGIRMSFIIILLSISVKLSVHSYWLKEIVSIVLSFVSFLLKSFSQGTCIICRFLCQKAMGRLKQISVSISYLNFFMSLSVNRLTSDISVFKDDKCLFVLQILSLSILFSE